MYQPDNPEWKPPYTFSVYHIYSLKKERTLYAHPHVLAKKRRIIYAHPDGNCSSTICMHPDTHSLDKHRRLITPLTSADLKKQELKIDPVEPNTSS